ncbi:MAG: hypothetical protein KF838_14935 [Phycisphaeraceae bacterium]|nr:MAG: hypothetical protein KF838_14935 [Phycisphaeraceae bacterium]
MPDPFDILGLPPRFDLDAQAIRRAHLARVASIHPDSQPRQNESGSDHQIQTEDEISRSAAALNAAKRTLEDPERRANVLLKRLGGATKEEDRSLPDGFLPAIMELREGVESALASKDPVQRRAVEADAASRRDASIARVTDLFRTAVLEPSTETLRRIRVELNAWRYIERLIEQLDPAYDPSVADFAE